MMRQKAGKDPAPIQGWNRYEVKDGQNDIQEKPKRTEKEQRVKNVIPSAQRRYQEIHGFQDDQEDQRGHHITGGTSCCNKDMIPFGIFQVTRIDGNRFRPTEDKPSHDEAHERENNAPDGVDMYERIQGHSAQVTTGGIPKPIRRPGMGRLVNT